MEGEKIKVVITKGAETQSFEADGLIISLTNNQGSQSLTYGEINVRDAAVLIYGFEQQCKFLNKQFGDIPIVVAAKLDEQDNGESDFDNNGVVN